MHIASPDAVPACARDAQINFKVDGRDALQTIANTPGEDVALDLTLR
jgi:hypothetical protein